MLQSRKVWAAIIGLIFIVVNAALNQEQIDPNTVTNAVMGIVAALMASIAVEDGMKAQAEAANTKAEATATTTTVTTPAAANVTVTPTADDNPPQPVVGRTGLM
jgi:hypothetical protein